MKRLVLGLLLVSLPALAQTPRDLYQQLAGSWETASGDFSISYNLAGNRLRIQGEACTNGGAGPLNCGMIDQAYVWGASQAVLREYPSYGNQPVQIVEFSTNRIVRKECNPMESNQVSITTEELTDADTLHFTSEMWVSGQSQPRSRREFTLRRVQTGLASASSTGGATSN